MLEYGEQDHGPLRAGLGDWTQRIRTGKIQPARPRPDGDDLSSALQDLARASGYGTAGKEMAS
jgi:hypothetical protein